MFRKKTKDQKKCMKIKSSYIPGLCYHEDMVLFPSFDASVFYNEHVLISQSEKSTQVTRKTNLVWLAQDGAGDVVGKRQRSVREEKNTQPEGCRKACDLQPIRGSLRSLHTRLPPLASRAAALPQKPLLLANNRASQSLMSHVQPATILHSSE